MSPASPERSLYRLALTSFAQMLPATMLSPAIRPLVAAQHGGDEAVMQAFLAVNMAGATAFTVLLAHRLEGAAHDVRWLRGLLLVDALLLAILPLGLPTPVFLALRMLQGAVHVGASTLLLARASALGRVVGAGRAMGLAGGSIALAVGLGSGIGGALLRGFGLPGPFVCAASLALLTALAIGRSSGAVSPILPVPGATGRPPWSTLAFPFVASFLGRFTVGLLVVTFALFAHRVHGVTDAAIGGLFMLLTLPFALLTYPAARVADRTGTRRVGAVGALSFGLPLALLPWLPASGLGPALFFAGVGAACLYAAALRSATGPAERWGRARVMGWLNVAGASGMALGPFAAWLIGEGAERMGIARHAAVFVAGAFLLACFATWSLARSRTGSVAFSDREIEGAWVVKHQR